MAHEDRILSQSEIDSLLKRILPKTDEPKAEKGEAASDKPVEPPAKPKEAGPIIKPVASFKEAEPDKSKQTVPLGQPQEPVKMTEFKMETAEASPSSQPVEPVKVAEPDKFKETVPLGQPQEPIKMTEFKMKPVDAPPSSQPVEAVKREPASGETAGMQKTVADLAGQVEKLAAAIETIRQLEGKVRNLEEMIKLMPDSNRTLNGRIDKISNALEILKDEKSDQSFIEGFKCSHCHSRGLVALYVKCTSCGKENWMGWWPEKSTE